MNIKDIDIDIQSTSLCFEDVVEYIPLLTTDNNVVSPNKIMHLEIVTDNLLSDLFFDCATGDYCFENNSSTIIDDIGQIIQSNFFKHRSLEEFLSSDNLKYLITEIKNIKEM